MADTDRRAATADAASFKDKLLQSSERDELSAPDLQALKPKLPPAKDAGTPPMTVSITGKYAGSETVSSTTAAAAVVCITWLAGLLLPAHCNIAISSVSLSGTS